MASSYSADLKLELMVTGENAGTWGDKTNTNLNLVQQAIAGFEQVTLSSGGTTALVMSDGALSNARNLVIKFATATIGASTICTIPDSIEKFYIFDCSGLTNPSNLTIKTASGSGFTPDAAKIYAAYADGTNLNEVSLDTLGGTIGTAQVADNTITAAKISNNAVTTAKILQSNVTINKMAPNSIGTAQILQSNVTLNKMAPNSVGPAQLQSTAVTAGDYTTADITVDEDGRITAASSGAAGSTNFRMTLAKSGPATGNFTANPATNIIVAYAGGGGGGQGFQTPGPAREGGRGGSGFFFFPITQPYGPHPYSVGGRGTSVGYSQQTGGNGGSTSLTPSPISAPGGGGGRNAGSGTVNNVADSPTAVGLNNNQFVNGCVGRGGDQEDAGGEGNDGYLYIFENIFS
jgi:hypothetical protein